MMYVGCMQDIYRMYVGCMYDIYRMYVGYMYDIYRMYVGCMQDVCRMYRQLTVHDPGHIVHNGTDGFSYNV